MHYIGSSKREKKRKNNKIIQIIVIIIAIIVSIYLLANMNLPILSDVSGAVVSFIDSIKSTVVGVVDKGADYFNDIEALQEENKKIKDELDAIKLQNIELNKIQIENEDLREQLNINEKYNHFDKVFANVIIRDYSNWNETFVINKGAKDGIKEKQTVISTEGLVGYISTVTDSTSIVTTILDPNTSVSVEISTVNALALAKGDFDLKDSGKMKLTHIPINTEVTVGEKVYTTGIGTLYEKGIIIGEIKEVINSKNDVDRYAIIEPYTDFASLDLVAVITD